MSVPAGIEARVLEGYEAEFERDLAGVPEDAFRELAGGGAFHVFLGEDSFFLVLETAPEDLVHRLGSAGAVAPLRDLLDRCTSFDPDVPDRSVARDVHHLLEAPHTAHGEGEGNF